MADWYIMSARTWIGDKPSINKIIEENNSEGTIMAVDKMGVKTFILGTKGNYGNVGDTKFFNIDTGNGYKDGGYCKIENIINIDKENITSSINNIGLNEKRVLWVFK